MADQNENIRPVGYDDEVNQPFDVQAHQGQYAMWKLLGAFAFLIVLALIIFFVYQPGSRDRHDPIVISPNKTALKIPPAETLTDPVKDKAIYGAGQNEPETAPIVPTTPEAPIKLPETVEIIEKLPKISTPQLTQPSKPAAAPITQTKPSPPSQTTGQSYEASGKHLVQVASLRSYEEAEATWNRITAKFTFLKGQPYDIKRVDLNEKGVYYRLRIDGLSSAASADAVCGKLQANGQACFKTSR